MLRKIGYSVLSACALFCTDALATNYNLAPAVTVEYDLPTNKPQVFSNYFFWTIKAVCTIHTQDSNDDILIKALNKKGKINGIPLSKGETLVVTVHNGDKMEISAESGAQVELTNHGLHSVKATCKT